MLVNNLCHGLDYSALFPLNGILLEEALHITAKRVFGVRYIYFNMSHANFGIVK